MNPETLKLVAITLNTGMVLLLAYGISRRRRPRVHMPVMLTAFAGDLLNVLLVEYAARQTQGEGAVEKGLKVMTGEGAFFQQFHIVASVLFILGYVVAVITGRRLYRKGVGRKAHQVNAAIFIATRLASFATSYWM